LLDITCTNHPERAAVENCEVCGVPLCAYCLYYTSDGQRLCKLHADQAEATGAFIRKPGLYADGLIGAQVAANRPKRGAPALYEGNNPDLLALLALVFGLISCVPGAICLVGPVGLVLSVLALVGAREARSPRRTRTMAGVGLALSGLWLVTTIGCVLLYLSWFSSVTASFANIQVTMQAQFTMMPATMLTPQGFITATPPQTPTPDLTVTPPF
jgi:hypothetical protein